LVLDEGTGVGGDGGDRLAGVDGAPAADSDDAIAAAVPQGDEGGVNVLEDGFRNDTVVDGGGDAGVGQ